MHILSMNSKLWHWQSMTNLPFLGSQAWYHSAVRVCTQRQSVGDDTNGFDWVLCHFGEINKAQKVFDSVSNSDMNVSFIGAMMKAFNANTKYMQTHILMSDDITSLLRWERVDWAVLMKKEWKYMACNIVQNRVTVKLTNDLMDFYAYFGQFDKVREMYSKLVTDSIADVSTVNTIMSAHNKLSKTCANQNNKLSLTKYSDRLIYMPNLERFVKRKWCLIKTETQWVQMESKLSWKIIHI